MKTWTYRGITIERSFPSGMYTALVDGRNYAGYVHADTLAGIRELIRETLAS